MRLSFLVGLLLVGCASNRSEPTPEPTPASPSQLDAAWQALRLHHVIACANPTAETAIHDATLWELQAKLAETVQADRDPEPIAGQVVSLFRAWCPEWDEWL